jgi:hypothetical protein
MTPPGGPQAGMAAAGVGGPGGAYGAGGQQLAEADYSDPVKGAESFLSAVQSKDPDRLADAVALRSPTEAEPKRQALFRSLLEGNAEPSTLDDLAAAFQGMRIVDMNNVKSTGTRGVIVERSEENGDTTRRTLYVRREKAGWKVKDFSNAKIIEGFNPQQRQNRPGGRGYGSSGGGL